MLPLILTMADNTSAAIVLGSPFHLSTLSVDFESFSSQRLLVVTATISKVSAAASVASTVCVLPSAQWSVTTLRLHSRASVRRNEQLAASS